VVLDGYAGSWFIVDSSVVGYDVGQDVREERRVKPAAPQTARDRAVLLLRAAFLPGWSPTAGQRLVWTIRGGVVLGVILLVAFAVDKTLWAWLELLIVPAVLAIGGYLFNSSQNRATRAGAEKRAQDAALQAYLDKMSELLIDGKLHKKADPYDQTRITARARTLTILRQLDGEGKKNVLLFLREARLINRYDYHNPKLEDEVLYHAQYVGLKDADLSGADLKGARLISSSGEQSISLQGADLSGADLRNADLSGADLSDADLSGADLRNATLKEAERLREVDLPEADLELTEPRKADLSGADLSGADLSDADLSGTRGVTNDVLEQQAKCLKGATMPNGQMYEDWLKDKEEGGGEDRENADPS